MQRIRLAKEQDEGAKPAMEIEYILTEEDKLAFCRHEVARMPGSERMRKLRRTWPTIILLVLLAPLLLVQVWHGPRDFRIVWRGVRLLLVVFTIALYFISFVLRRSLPEKLARGFLPQGDKAGVIRKQRTRITPEGISNDSDHTGHTADWANVERIDVTDDYAFIYLSGGNYPCILPRRAFARDRDFDEFVATAKCFRDNATATFGQF
jgi:YcxB-like protein